MDRLVCAEMWAKQDRGGHPRQPSRLPATQAGGLLVPTLPTVVAFQLRLSTAVSRTAREGGCRLPVQRDQTGARRLGQGRSIFSSAHTSSSAKAVEMARPQMLLICRQKTEIWCEAHKEKLRKLKVSQSTLTMSATPISARAQFSLMGRATPGIIRAAAQPLYPLTHAGSSYGHDLSPMPSFR